MIIAVSPVGPIKFNACSANAAVTGSTVTVNAILDDIASDVLTSVPRGINSILICYRGGNGQSSINAKDELNAAYCSCVIIHMSGAPRNPFGPKFPVSANDAVCTYAKNCAVSARDAVNANDAVYCDPEANG